MVLRVLRGQLAVQAVVSVGAIVRTAHHRLGMLILVWAADVGQFGLEETACLSIA